MDEMKVYCKGCKYVRFYSCYEAVGDCCLRTITLKPDPYEKSYSIESIYKANANNDCKYYEKKAKLLHRIMRKVYRLTR